MSFFSRLGDAVGYASGKDTYVKILKGELPGAATVAEVNSVADMWLQDAYYAWYDSYINYELFEADQALIEKYRQLALQRVATGSKPMYQQTPSGQWIQTPTYSSQPGYTQALNTTTNYTPWLLAGGLGLAAVLLFFTLKGK